MSQWLNPLLRADSSSFQLNVGLLAFRVAVSLSMLHTHGLKKVLHFEESIAHIPDPFGIGGFLSTLIAIAANIGCTIMVSLGLFTRLASLIILSVTLVGFFIVHGGDPWAVRDVPLMYSLAFRLIAWMGAGKFSLDAKLFSSKVRVV